MDFIPSRPVKSNYAPSTRSNTQNAHLNNTYIQQRQGNNAPKLRNNGISTHPQKSQCLHCGKDTHTDRSFKPSSSLKSNGNSLPFTLVKANGKFLGGVSGFGGDSDTGRIQDPLYHRGIQRGDIKKGSVFQGISGKHIPIPPCELKVQTITGIPELTDERYKSSQDTDNYEFGFWTFLIPNNLSGNNDDLESYYAMPYAFGFPRGSNTLDPNNHEAMLDTKPPMLSSEQATTIAKAIVWNDYVKDNNLDTATFPYKGIEINIIKRCNKEFVKIEVNIIAFR